MKRIPKTLMGSERLPNPVVVRYEGVAYNIQAEMPSVADGDDEGGVLPAGSVVPWALQAGYVVPDAGPTTRREIELLWEIADYAKAYLEAAYLRMTKGYGWREIKHQMPIRTRVLGELVIEHKAEMMRSRGWSADPSRDIPPRLPLADVLEGLPSHLAASPSEVTQLRRLVLMVEAWLARLHTYERTGTGKADRDLFYAAVGQQIDVLSTLYSRRAKELAELGLEVAEPRTA